jgi:hypothetical protein
MKYLELRVSVKGRTASPFSRSPLAGES